MEADLRYIESMFKANTNLVKKATEEVRPEHWFVKPGEASNHLMWVQGHLVWSRGNVLKTLGAGWFSPWSSLFARGAKPVAADEYPGVEEIRRTWDEVSGELATCLAGAPADLLARPAPNGAPSFDGKVGGLVAFLAFHETYHVGQVSYLRKWLGYGQTVG